MTDSILDSLKSYKGNIWKLQVLTFIQWFLLTIPILVLFYQQNGLDLQQVFLVQVIFSVGLIALEIPSGYFADYFGRKNALILGFVLNFVGFAIYSLGSGFGTFLLAEIFLGMGMSFISGADSALMYDSLLIINQEKEFKKINGKTLAWSSFSEGLASILGGLLALVSLQFPFYFQTAVFFLAIPIVLSLKEPPRQSSELGKEEVQSMKNIIRYAVHGHPELKWIIFYTSVIWASTFAVVWLIQPYWQSVGVPLVYFGILWSFFQFSRVGFSLAAHYVEQKVGLKNVLVLFPFLVLAAYLLLLFHAIWAIVFMLLFYFVYGISRPIFLDMMNSRIDSSMRATVLSVSSFGSRFLFCVFGPLVGWIGEKYGILSSFLTLGVVFGGLGVVALFFLRKYGILKYKDPKHS